MSRVAGPFGQRNTPAEYNKNSTDRVGVGSQVGIFLAVVKANNDAKSFNRIQVFIPDFGGDPEHDGNWVTVNYASPMAGASSLYEQGENYSEYADTIKSYGMWTPTPPVDSWVLVGFAGGRIDEGFYLAQVFQRGTQISIPGLPRQKTYDGDNYPAAPKNKKDPDPDLKKYVTHKPLWEAVKKQGIEKDYLRGLSTSGAERESPSRVFGILTPEQQQFIIDDGDKDGNNMQMRLRTRNGTQILLDDSTGHIYLISKEGENWIEMSVDGQIHIYGSKDINIHSQKNINLRSDLDVNIEAGRAISLRSREKDITLHSGAAIHSTSVSDTHITSQASIYVNAAAGYYETAPVIHMNGPIATPATPTTDNTLTVNDIITSSICTVVPEHEPWRGHAGKFNSSFGSANVKQDPDPEQTPRQPTPEENPATGEIKEDTMQNIDDVNVSKEMQGCMKTDTGFTPAAVDAMGNQTGHVGFGTEYP
jgi:hypothetical protein